MASIKKPFSRALYEAYDGKAKDRLAEYLQSVGHTIVSTKEDFNVDVVSQKGDYTYFNEAEVKTGWKGTWNPSWAEIGYLNVRVGLSTCTKTKVSLTSISSGLTCSKPGESRTLYLHKRV